MKIIIANALLGIIGYEWYQHVGRAAFVANGPFGLTLLAVGIGLGIWCAHPSRSNRCLNKSRHASAPPSVAVSDPFAQITE